jgi:hypothetical protein
MHGAGRALRKWIWIMPMIVSGKDGDDPEQGHIYQVDDPA